MADSEHLRPLHQHGPHLSCPGRRRHRATRLLAASLIVLSLAFAAACQGSDAQPAPTAPAVSSAADVVPDLSDAGFRVHASGKLPTLTPDQDAFIAIFAGSKPGVSSVRVEVNLLATTEAARSQFGAIADALRNPPPDLFGPGTTQVDGMPVYEAEGRRSYVTARADTQGNLVYSDAYRMGRVIAIVYTLASDAEAAKAVRRLVAERIDARAPR